MNQRFSAYLQSYKKEAGQSIIEFALIATTLMFTLFAIVDVGRAMNVYTYLAGAAQAGARAGAVSSDVAVVQAAVQTHMSGLDTNSLTIDVNQVGNYTEVTLTYLYEPITPLITSFSGGISLSNTARIRKLGGQ